MRRVHGGLWREEAPKPSARVALPGPQAAPEAASRVRCGNICAHLQAFLLAFFGPRLFSRCTFLGTVIHVTQLFLLLPPRVCFRMSLPIPPAGSFISTVARLLHIVRAGVRQVLPVQMVCPPCTGSAWAHGLRGWGSGPCWAALGSPVPSGTAPRSCRGSSVGAGPRSAHMRLDFRLI